MPLPMRAFQGPLLPAGGRAVVVRAAGRGARAGVTAGVGGRGHAEDMAWVGQLVRDDALVAAYTQVSYLADWSRWLPFETGVAEAPRQPGAYLFREPETQVVRYVGMAGERAGGGRPRGLHGRLSGYCSGHDPVGGFGESALDRALADPGWVERQLARGVPTARVAPGAGPPTRSPGSRPRSAGPPATSARTPDSSRARSSCCCGPTACGTGDAGDGFAPRRLPSRRS